MWVWNNRQQISQSSRYFIRLTVVGRSNVDTTTLRPPRRRPAAMPHLKIATYSPHALTPNTYFITHWHTHPFTHTVLPMQLDKRHFSHIKAPPPYVMYILFSNMPVVWLHGYDSTHIRTCTHARICSRLNLASTFLPLVRSLDPGYLLTGGSAKRSGDARSGAVRRDAKLPRSDDSFITSRSGHHTRDYYIHKYPLHFL